MTVNICRNHGYETPQQALQTDSSAGCGALYPQFCRIVKLRKFASSQMTFRSLHFLNWSFTNKQKNTWNEKEGTYDP